MSAGEQIVTLAQRLDATEAKLALLALKLALWEVATLGSTVGLQRLWRS